MTARLTRGERVSLVFDEACRRWSVDSAELRGKSRLGAFTAPRCAIVLALRRLTPQPLAYSVIGEHLGGRDQSAARHLAHRGRYIARRSTGFSAALEDLIAIARGVQS